MTKTPSRPMGDVLWEAANTYLNPSDRGGLRNYSCNAALFAESPDCRRSHSLREIRHEAQTDKFLTSLGCDSRTALFNEFKAGEERQGARYLWLLLAVCVADDEGLVVEVPA